MRRDILRRRPLRGQRGFSLLELMVVAATIAIIAAIAVPNARTAMRKARHGAAYKSMKVLETGIHAYMLDNNQPPLTLNVTTLEPLGSMRYLGPGQHAAILGALEFNRLIWYYGSAGDAWFDYDYGVCFRPRRDPGNVWCYMWPEGMYRWDNGEWTVLM